MTISLGETHVHISNTNVKPQAADGSAMYCGVRVGYCQAFFIYIDLLKFFRACFEGEGDCFERSFGKDLSSSLKSRAAALLPIHFATLLQNNEKFLRV